MVKAVCGQPELGAALQVAIWTIKLSPGAEWTLPAAAPEASRRLYFFAGSALEAGGVRIPPRHGMTAVRGAAVPLANTGADDAELLLLQGRPISEPVAQRGPFVMNKAEEIMQAMQDYRSGMFGRWPWGTNDPVHDLKGRFAVHADGRREDASA